MVKNPNAKAGDVRDTGLISGLGRSPGGVHGNPLQYSCLENPMEQRGLVAARFSNSSSLQVISRDSDKLGHLSGRILSLIPNKIPQVSPLLANTDLLS